MTTVEMKTLTQLLEIERCQILPILSLAQTNLFMAGYPFTGHRSSLVHTDGALLWLQECQHFLSPLYTLYSQRKLF